MIDHRSKAMLVASLLTLSLTGCLLPPMDEMGIEIQTAPPPERAATRPLR